MDTLFEIGTDDDKMFEGIISAINAAANDIVQELGHKKGTIRVERNETKNEVNFPVSIAESPYVFGPDNSSADATLTRIFTLVKTTAKSKNPHCVEVRLPTANAEKFSVPGGSVEKTRKNGSSVFVRLNNHCVVDSLIALVRNALQTYRSTVQPAFGCCDRYLECSEKGMCTHPNRIYGSVCLYRQQLESGMSYFGTSRTA